MPLYKVFCVPCLSGRLAAFVFAWPPMIRRVFFMLQIHDLTMVHRRDLRPLIQDLDLTINPGDKLAIIGEEGNGKSSLLKYLMGDRSIEEYLVVTGSQTSTFNQAGYLAQTLEPREMKQRVSDFFFSQNSLEMLDYGRLYELGDLLSFDPDRIYSDQIISTLSGGERIKLQFLTLLVQNPDILFLDEPSNDLDIQTVEWLESFIQQARQTIVFVSHDESLLTKAASAILHLELLLHRSKARHTYLATGFEEYRSQRDRDFEYQDRVARKQRAEDKARMERYRQISNKVEHQLQTTRLDTTGRLLAKKYKSVKAQGRRFERERENFLDIPIQEDAIRLEFNGVSPLPPSKELIRLDKLILELDQERQVGPINFTWTGQDKLGIVGPNGVGKSTLLRYIYQHISNKEGFNLGYMAQNYEEEVDLSASPVTFMQKTGDKEEETQIRTYLASLNFSLEEMDRPVVDLSGGQRAKLLLANLSFQEANILLLDEPTRNISPTSQAALRSSLRNYPGAILAVSHDRFFLKEVCDAIYELSPRGLVEKSL